MSLHLLSIILQKLPAILVVVTVVGRKAHLTLILGYLRMCNTHILFRQEIVWRIQAMRLPAIVRQLLQIFGEDLQESSEGYLDDLVLFGFTEKY